MEEVINALELKKELDALRPIDPEQEGRIMQKFRLDWNYHSNHLEGNALTYGETKALILFGITAQGKPLKDTLEMTGHNEAIDWVLEMLNGERPLTESFIRELHTLLLRKPYQKKAKTPDGKPTTRTIKVGEYKSVPNHVETATGEMFYFATPEETPAKMHDLLNWYREKKEQPDTNPIFLAAEFHYQFIRIHPFDDGNGRTARILMNFILMQYGYPPVIIRTEDKENYFAVLQLADAGSIEPFIFYIAQNLVRSLDIMIAGANGEDIEDPDDLDKEIALLEQRLNSFGEKSVSVKSIDVIMDIINSSLVPLATLYEKKSLKFKAMYLLFETNFFSSVNAKEPLLGLSYISGEEYATIGELKSSISLEVISIGIKFDFLTFKHMAFGAFQFESEIQFKLSNRSYDIFIGDDEILQKPYGSQLSAIEINSIIKLELNRHKTFIEQKISEKETPNPSSSSPS